jgi:long-chain acyl-CoA synthetase
MTVLQKLIGRNVTNEQDYFNALMTSITSNGKILSLGQMLERSQRLFPDNIAIICNDAQMTYRELYQRASALSKKVVEKGVQPRDRALLFFENSIEFYVGYFAIVQTGAVVAPLNTFLQQTELTHIFNDAKPSLIVTHSSHVELFKKIEQGKDLPILTEQDMDMQKPAKTDQHFPVVVLEPDEMAALLYTSGTTGLPKGVMLSSKNIMTNICQGIAFFGLQDSERLLGLLPLFHSFSQNTCLWTSLFSGCSVIIVPKIERRSIIAALEHKPTIILAVPAVYGLFCLLKTLSFDTVKFFISGGDALSDKILMAFGLLYRRKICNGYGLTEACPMVSADLEDITEPTSNIGRPLPNVEVAIIDEHGKKREAGNIGELIIKGDNIMLGYYNAPEQTAATLKNGWLYTGDLAYLDDKGKIVITGRIKDLIIHKGINIYPQEIENIIMSHPLVIRVGVIGKLDEATGEVPIAFVQLRSAHDGIEKELKDLCTKNLAGYKVPREFLVTVDNLPLTATGKVDKKVLRKKR